MSSSAPVLSHLLETCIYVEDMARARAFYEGVMGLSPHFGEDRITGYRVGDTMLLLFKARGTLEPVETGGGTIPPHDGSGPAHFAFSIPRAAVSAWREHFESKGIPVESTVDWPRDGATSLYVRDPDEHLVELASRGLWGID